MHRSISIFLCCIGLFSIYLDADLLIDPTGGTVLFSDSAQHDDQVIRRSLGFTGLFYGVPSTTADVSTNGLLNFNLVAGSQQTLPASLPVIAPFWVDLIINAGDGASIVENMSPGIYYAATWLGMENSSTLGPERASFQVVWFGSSTVINGFPFLAGDLAFSYETDVITWPSSSSPTVGISTPVGSLYASPFPSGTANPPSQLPTLPGTFLLFRPNASGNYDVIEGDDRVIASLNGQARYNRDIYQTDLYNVLTWNNPSPSTIGYIVFRNGEQIATLPSGPLSYQDHNRRPNRSYQYSVVAITPTEEISLGTVVVQTGNH